MRAIKAVSVATVLFSPIIAHAELQLTPSVSMGYKKVTFGSGGTSPSEVSMPTLGLGFAATIDRFSVQANIEHSAQDGRYREVSGPAFVSSVGSPYTEMVSTEIYNGDLSRQDISLIFNYLLNDKFAVFAGYLDNVSEMDSLSVSLYDEQGEEVPITLSFDDGSTDIARLGGSFRQRDYGALAGIRYIPLATNFGSLSLTLGYAILQTDTDLTVSLKSSDFFEKQKIPTSNSDTTGASASIGWVGNIPGVKSLHYVGSLRANRFTQKDDVGKTNNDLTYAGVGLLYTL